MNYTCAEASKVLRKLNEDLKVLRAKEVKGYRFTAAVDEDLESARPLYNYVQTQEEQRLIEAKIRKVKHAINCFNIRTVIPEFGMTVDEMLVYLCWLCAFRGSALRPPLPRAEKPQRETP